MSPAPTILTLSRKRRRITFQLLALIFVIAAPLLFLYATGYRFERVAGLTETGGIYVGAEESGTEIYLNDELVHETGTFRRAFYIEGLNPGTYTVRISKEEYHPWGKTLIVYPQIVTEAQAFNMPTEPVLTLIPSTFTNQTTNATSTKSLPNPVYKELLTHFATTSATTSAVITTKPVVAKNVPTRAVPTGTSTVATKIAAVATSTKEFRGMQLYDEGLQIVARWMRSKESAPFYFRCVDLIEAECANEIALNTKEEKPLHFDFFPGTTDLVMVTLKDGVYVTELDNRSGQNIQPLFLAKGADFRIIDGGIYIKTEDDRLYKVEI